MQNAININTFEQFTHQLNDALKACLNKNAQQKMMPKGRITNPDFTNPPKKSAVLILFYPDSGAICFPLIRRPNFNGAHSGQMALPGGKFEDTDHDLIHTALRETHEEIGIPRTSIRVLGLLSDHFIPITNLLVQPVIGFVNHKPTFITNKNEVAELFEINLKEFLTDDIKKRELWNLRGNPVEVPFYFLQNQKVWGATAMILSELENVLLSFLKNKQA